MVCKECGAYNAEHLSHCRVCAARLTDVDEPVQQEETAVQEEAPRDPELPKREFARAPKWPKQAYSGAPEKPAYQPPKEEPEEETFASSFDEPEETPAAKPEPARRSAAVAKPLADRKLGTAADKPAPSAKPAKAEEKNPGGARFCPYCGKPLLPDAPFCPYCGKNAGLPTVFDEPETDEQPAPVSRAAKPVAAPVPARRPEPRKPAPVPEPEEEDDAADEDEEDDLFGDDKKPARRAGLSRFASRGAKARPADDEDADDEDLDDDEYEDDEYDDDAHEDDDLPKKHSGKSTTILFWGLIVLLVALIVVFGMYIVKKNYGGDIGNMFASLSGNKPTATDAPSATDVGGTGTVDNPLFGTGTIEENPDDASEFLVTVYAPTGSTVLLVTPTELMNGGKTTIPSLDKVGLRVPKTAFLPNTPLTSPTITIQPNIQVTTPAGETYQVEINEITMPAETLSLNITEPLTDTVNARYGNQPITIKGTVSDEYASVYVNDKQTTVYVGGEFTAEFQPAGSAEAETVTIEARKNNMVTATYTLTIAPYVEQNMALAVTNDLTTLASTTGKVTLTGTVTPGAALTATCPLSSSVVCGTVSVSAAGNFSVNVTAGDVGAFPVVVTATQEGYKDATATIYVEHWPDASTSSQKTSWKKKCTTLSAAEHKKLVDGTNSVTNYSFTGKVTEIVGSNGLYTIVKMELTSGEVVYLANRSKNTLASDDLNKKKTIAGSYAGSYLDTKLPLVFGWYIWNVA